MHKIQIWKEWTRKQSSLFLNDVFVSEQHYETTLKRALEMAEKFNAKGETFVVDYKYRQTQMAETYSAYQESVKDKLDKSLKVNFD